MATRYREVTAINAETGGEIVTLKILESFEITDQVQAIVSAALSMRPKA